MIAEELLHFVWQLRLFNQLNLFSQSGESIRVLHPGRHNKDAGPDFLHAIIQIDGYEWHGHIEIHVDGLDWNRHQHQFDPAYNNVVLHVVMHNPAPALREDGSTIPSLSLAASMDMTLIQKYNSMMKDYPWIPCAKLVSNLANIFKIQALERALLERLKIKGSLVLALLQDTGRDWERTLFIMLCRAFGMKVNAETFLAFGKQLDFSLLRKQHANPKGLEAFLFGQAGMLATTVADDYIERLQSEYNYLKQLYQLKSPIGLHWKSMRMRPYNFPAFRMAQLAALYGRFPYLFQKVIDARDLKELVKMFLEIKASSYWEQHFSLGKPSASQHTTQLTTSFIEHLVINVFVPILFSYGKYTSDVDLQQQALDWLMDLPAERNSITKAYLDLQMPIASAADSQAVLQLHSHYCQAKRCLQCAIGSALLKP